MKIDVIKATPFDAWADEHGIHIEAQPGSRQNGESRYMVTPKNASGEYLYEVTESGETPIMAYADNTTNAVAALASRMSGKRILIGDPGEDRKVSYAPMFARWGDDK